MTATTAGVVIFAAIAAACALGFALRELSSRRTPARAERCERLGCLGGCGDDRHRRDGTTLAFEQGRRVGYLAGFDAGAEHERTEADEDVFARRCTIDHTIGPCNGLPRPECPGYDRWLEAVGGTLRRPQR